MTDTDTRRGTGQELYERAKQLIPGGTQLLSKRPEMLLPGGWPAYYETAKGVEIWDLDGRRLVDVGYHGIGACVLGYADADVDAAVVDAIRAGSTSILNCREEVELAELLVDLHPWADMVRFTRAGGEGMAMAARIARASTGRSTIAFCGYHGWHDWYLAANLGGGDDALEEHLLPGLNPSGVPRGLAGSMLPFHYNDLDALRGIVERSGDDLAAIVMEPVRSSEPTPGFLEGVRDLTTQAGAVLVFDEVTSGWRINTGGAHLIYGVDPDVAVFAKSISNGYPMGAVIGRREVMEAAQGSFISSTSWSERTGPAAALAAINKHRRIDAPTVLQQAGQTVRLGWLAAADSAGLALRISGMDPLLHFDFAVDNALAARTLFTQLMLEEGYLATSSFYATVAHTDAVLETYIETTARVFDRVAKAVASDTVEQSLAGPVAHAGFYRLS